MSQSTQSKLETLHIKEDADGHRPVLLHPEDNDLFVRTGKQVIEACRLGISVELWLSEFQAMLEEVQRWTAARAASVRACFAAARGARVALYFVPPHDQFDFDLAEQLAELNAELVKRFNIGMVEIYQIPWAELDRFINPKSARQIYGTEQPAAHPAVEA
jgi:hypothetical protein